jgi:mono/diheme cytochrome c family protein
MNTLNKFCALVAGVALAASCNSGEFHRNTGRTYAPDMVYSRAVDYYHGFEKIEAEKGTYTKMPVLGTIAREQAMPDHIGKDDTLAANANTCKIDLTEADLKEGQRLYLIHCGICHGTALDGNGPLYSSGKFAAMPANLKSGPKYLAMSQGRIYHAIVYGKNSMGAYASQLDTKQRWKVVAYIKKVQSENGGEPFTMVKTASASSTDTTAKAAETAQTTAHN